MTTIELLKSYPLATEVTKEWFLKEMLLSFNDDSVPQDFKDMMLSEGITDEKLVKLIDAQPRVLFDVFDENNIFINVTKNDAGWSWDIGNKIVTTGMFEKRKQAEKHAIHEAFADFEVNLSPLTESVQEITTTITPEE